MKQLDSSLIRKYREKGVLLDSSLLLLFVVGALDRAGISVFKRTAQYTEDDFVLLAKVVDRFNRVLTTPNILTEVSGFLGQFKRRPRSEVQSGLSRIVGLLDERYVQSQLAAGHDCFQHFGLTDTGITLLSEGTALVLTDDSRLRDELWRRGVDAVNFHNLRTWRLG